MGDFDLSLIREFRSRPSFYDRNSPRFKDKIYTAHEWQEISNKLGYDVSLLKDRMLQLRNRYNLEKRRMETLRDENPGKRIQTPWPLYDQLHFLSDHIRARRSYKRMAPIQVTASAAVSAELSNSESNLSLCPESAAAAAPFANGLLAVKMEENDSDDAESESPSGPETDAFVASDHPAMLAQATLRDHSINLAPSAGVAVQDLSMHLPTSLPPSITIRRLDTMREAAIQQQQQQQQLQLQQQQHRQQQQQQMHLHQRQQQQLQQQQQRPSKRANNIKTNSVAAENYDEMRLNARERKYAAFGHFMSSSLLELPPKKALLLVEKFTSELVKVLVQKSDAADAQVQVATPLSPSSATSINGDANGAQ